MLLTIFLFLHLIATCAAIGTIVITDMLFPLRRAASDATEPVHAGHNRQ